MGLDDIRVLPSCPIRNERFCDFEGDNMCGYVNDPNNIYDWARGSQATLNSGPPIDQLVNIYRYNLKISYIFILLLLVRLDQLMVIFCILMVSQPTSLNE